MRKLSLIVAVAATVLLLDSGMASARGCRGGRGGRRGGGGCGGGSCYSGGCGGGGCYSGGYGYGGYAGGCATCGGGGYASAGGSYASGYCAECAQAGVPQMAAAGGLNATVIVQLPADATLTIDDAPTTSTSERRVFVTPDLKPGKTFHYTLKAKVKQDGKVVTVTREVAVEAGKISQISLPFPPTTTVAAK